MPLNQDTIEYLEELVEEYMRDGDSFTSLDIANQAKQAGYFTRNRWVADWLRSNAIVIAHDMGALFNQTLIRVDSKVEGPTLAYLYHHMNNDPDEYLDRDQNPVSYRSRKTGRDFPQLSDLDLYGDKGTTQTAPSGSFTTQDGGGHKRGRDTRGRFSSGNQPTHWKNQRRDGKGRFIG